MEDAQRAMAPVIGSSGDQAAAVASPGTGWAPSRYPRPGCSKGMGENRGSHVSFPNGSCSQRLVDCTGVRNGFLVQLVWVGERETKV